MATSKLTFLLFLTFIALAPTVAPALLRLHFHDCFVRGCDESVVLKSTANSTAERDSVPNQSPKGFQVKDAVKDEVEKQCPDGVCNAQKLSLKYYRKTCPSVESIVKTETAKIMSVAPTLAAPLLRMHFHDCFVRGCDGSVLINSTSSNQAEKDGIPNLTLRGYGSIDRVKTAVEKKCPGVVSCADILALVARDATVLVDGPSWPVPLGRRDGRVSFANETLANLPPPSFNITQLKASFASKNLTAKDLVVLSGSHTIGTSHCSSFTNRLYNFTGVGDADPSLDANYAARLRTRCTATDQTTLVEMDPGSFKTFDQDYYTLVAKRRGLFTSDSALLADPETRAYVLRQARNKKVSFPRDFARSMVKMGKIQVLTGRQGEVRRRCAFVN